MMIGIDLCLSEAGLLNSKFIRGWENIWIKIEINLIKNRDLVNQPNIHSLASHLCHDLVSFVYRHGR